MSEIGYTLNKLPGGHRNGGQCSHVRSRSDGRLVRQLNVRASGLRAGPCAEESSRVFEGPTKASYRSVILW
ncbi:hypothetical protein J6590_036632 [Homalodisca vitripennis]|nr:hypothetical protein J6590_036632 [Homalodisca vitripennis]